MGRNFLRDRARDILDKDFEGWLSNEEKNRVIELLEWDETVDEKIARVIKDSIVFYVNKGMTKR